MIVSFYFFSIYITGLKTRLTVVKWENFFLKKYNNKQLVTLITLNQNWFFIRLFSNRSVAGPQFFAMTNRPKFFIETTEP